jgi:putative transposase
MVEDSPRTIERAYRVRCYPTKAQARTLAQLFGAKRFVWNWALARKSDAYRLRKEKISTNQLSNEFTQLKKQPELSWLDALPREPFDQLLRDLNAAYTNFFAKRAKFPRFKKKSYAAAVRFKLDQRRTQVDREAGRVQLDGIGKLKFKATEELVGRLRSATVSRDGAGRFFISFTADRVPVRPVSASQVDAVGIDQGVRELLVTSANERTAVSRALEVKARRLRRYQRSQSRKLRAAAIKAGLDPSKPLPKGTRLQKSKRFGRNRIRIARLHAQVADARRDLLHKATTDLVARHALIGIRRSREPLAS